MKENTYRRLVAGLKQALRVGCGRVPVIVANPGHVSNIANVMRSVDLIHSIAWKTAFRSTKKETAPGPIPHMWRNSKPQATACFDRRTGTALHGLTDHEWAVL
jgi:hypothetical protein